MLSSLAFGSSLHNRLHSVPLRKVHSRNSRPLVVCRGSDSPSSVPSGTGKRIDLSRALMEAIREQTLPWVNDIIYAIIGYDDELSKQAATAPTVPPNELSDADSQFAKLPSGVILHYKDWPATEKNRPLILLMHGYNGSEFSFRAVAPALAYDTGCRVVAFDRPPFGLSSRPLKWGKDVPGLDFNPYEQNGSATLVEQFLDHLEPPDKAVIVVGHSAGALVALELYNRRSKQVRALALIAPAIPSTREHSLARRLNFGDQMRFLITKSILQSDTFGIRFVQRQLLKQRDRVQRGRLGFVPHASTSPTVRKTPSSLRNNGTGSNHGKPADKDPLDHAIEGYLRPLSAHHWDSAALLNMRYMSWPQEYDYSHLKAPTCIITGESDSFITENARELVSLLNDMEQPPMVRYRELECGHVPMEEAPHDVTNEIVKFLRDSNLI